LHTGEERTRLLEGGDGVVVAWVTHRRRRRRPLPTTMTVHRISIMAAPDTNFVFFNPAAAADDVDISTPRLCWQGIVDGWIIVGGR
jgi:hypothetical protein